MEVAQEVMDRVNGAPAPAGEQEVGPFLGSFLGLPPALQFLQSDEVLDGAEQVDAIGHEQQQAMARAMALGLVAGQADFALPLARAFYAAQLESYELSVKQYQGKADVTAAVLRMFDVAGVPVIDPDEVSTDDGPPITDATVDLAQEVL